jgi:hypothetical protein
MALRLIQFLAIILTALALVPSGAHLAAMPTKMAMAQAAYFAAQQVYAGWALFGIVRRKPCRQPGAAAGHDSVSGKNPRQRVL